jgi:hypothetical protein
MPVMDTATAPQLADLIEDAVVRLREALAILDTIEHAELLSELPSSRDGAARHQSGVSLLTILKRELMSIRTELSSSHQVHDLISRISVAGEPE